MARDETSIPSRGTHPPKPWRVWISGASSGIGAELARQLAHRGSSVALFARREELLESLRDDIVEGLVAAPSSLEPRSTADPTPPRILVHAGDVTDREAVRRSIADTERELGGIDLLFLNAGIGDLMPPDRFDLTLVERIYKVNFLGAIYAIEAALPSMLERRQGIIAGVSSIASVRGLPTAAPYCSSKAALSNFLQSLRVDLRDRGIRVINITPGFIKTPLTDRNRFPMPFLLPVDRAVTRLIRAIEKGRREIHFPRRLTVPMKLLGCMPAALSDWILARAARRQFGKAPSAH